MEEKEEGTAESGVEMRWEGIDLRELVWLPRKMNYDKYFIHSY